MIDSVLPWSTMPKWEQYYLVIQLTCHLLSVYQGIYLESYSAQVNSACKRRESFNNLFAYKSLLQSHRADSRRAGVWPQSDSRVSPCSLSHSYTSLLFVPKAFEADSHFLDFFVLPMNELPPAIPGVASTSSFRIGSNALFPFEHSHFFFLTIPSFPTITL